MRGVGPKELVITNEADEVVFKAPVWPELAAEVLDRGANGDLPGALRAMFKDQADAEVFMDEYHPSVNDLADLMEGLYGQSQMGEALASGFSSTNAGTP